MEKIQRFVNVLIDDNKELKRKAFELEALLASSYDVIEEQEQAILEISCKFETLKSK